MLITVSMFAGCASMFLVPVAGDIALIPLLISLVGVVAAAARS